MAKRPNILYIFTDQQSSDAMSCAGNGDLRTPAMDCLAAEGVRFDRTYCTQPLCSPSRASMFSGLVPQQAGVPRNHMAYAEHVLPHTMGHLFSDAGYECVYGGKWHIPEIAIPEGHGFRQICGFDDQHLANACIDFLRQKHDRPFLMVASFDNPHNICEWARNMALPWGPLADPPSPDECPELPANFAVPENEPDIVRLERDQSWIIYPTRYFSEDLWRQYRWAYYRLAERVDAEIGKILDGLSQCGLDDDTVVIFSSDHGDGHGGHQWSQKSVLYEEAVHVPLIVRYKGRTPAGRVDREHLISNGLDLLPTLCDWAGIEPPSGRLGRSFRPLAEGATPSEWRDEVVVETIFDGQWNLGTRGRALVTDRWKYIVYDRGRPREQLFDLAADPGETRSLAGDPSAAEALADCRRRTARWCAAVEPPGRWPFRVPGHETEA
ncbi:MAG: sulfatase-like hydrolase/transferase [Planctomycetes bacterium]|nr:sulfatase-like hydrolase/transferase [Planctomycetota bacterium]